KPKLAILAATFACLTQGAGSVRAQQAYPGGGYPYTNSPVTRGVGPAMAPATVHHPAAQAPVYFVTSGEAAPYHYPAAMPAAAAGMTGAPNFGTVPVSAQAGAATVTQPAPPMVYPNSAVPGTVTGPMPPTVMGTVPEGTGVVVGPSPAIDGTMTHQPSGPPVSGSVAP